MPTTDRNLENIRAIFATIDKLGGADFEPARRPEQPPMPSFVAVLDDSPQDEQADKQQ